LHYVLQTVCNGTRVQRSTATARSVSISSESGISINISISIDIAVRGGVGNGVIAHINVVGVATPGGGGSDGAEVGLCVRVCGNVDAVTSNDAATTVATTATVATTNAATGAGGSGDCGGVTVDLEKQSCILIKSEICARRVQRTQMNVARALAPPKEHHKREH
jgi:hypothetical protein